MCLAIPGEIIEVREGDDLDRTGRVRFGGIVKEVNLAFVPDAKVGDYALVHVGVAISTIDPEEARQVFRYLEQMDELAEIDAPPA